jgi:hypothetical protein
VCVSMFMRVFRRVYVRVSVGNYMHVYERERVRDSM